MTQHTACMLEHVGACLLYYICTRQCTDYNQQIYPSTFMRGKSEWDMSVLQDEKRKNAPPRMKQLTVNVTRVAARVNTEQRPTNCVADSPTGPACKNSSHKMVSVTLSSSPPTYIVASKYTSRYSESCYIKYSSATVYTRLDSAPGLDLPPFCRQAWRVRTLILIVRCI